MQSFPYLLLFPLAPNCIFIVDFLFNAHIQKKVAHWLYGLWHKLSYDKLLLNNLPLHLFTLIFKYLILQKHVIEDHWFVIDFTNSYSLNSTAQIEGEILSHNCKTDDVVWDEVLSGKKPTWGSNKCRDANVALGVWKNYMR